jgi:hypothetical protein
VVYVIGCWESVASPKWIDCAESILEPSLINVTRVPSMVAVTSENREIAGGV